MPLELYLNVTSPYARVVRVCVLEKGLEERLVLNWVDPWADDAELLEVNPNAKVPALCTEDRISLTETLPILFYLDSLSPPLSCCLATPWPRYCMASAWVWA